MTVAGPAFTASGRAGTAMSSLLAALQQRHHHNIKAVLFYGSCLRSGDLYDGLVDLYVLVDDYRRAHASTVSAWTNALLPPNVYYMEAATAEGTVRCKYAVLTLNDLERGCSKRWFQSYIWGRFAQPVALAWSAEEGVSTRVRAALVDAARTFLDNTRSLVEPSGAVREWWITGLAASYRTELRAESGSRATELVDLGLDYYLAITQEVAASLEVELDSNAGSLAYQIQKSPERVGAARWRVRRLQGKTLSVLRLLKALFTFAGGLDYIAWKLERHSGKPIQIPDRVRRWPLIFIWGLMWRLYRDGVFK